MCRVVGDWKRQHGKTGKEYWRAQATAKKAAAAKQAKEAARSNARKAAAAPKKPNTLPAVVKAMTATRARERSRRLPMIGGDFDNGRTETRLIEATEKYLRLLYAEAMSEIRNRPHA